MDNRIFSDLSIHVSKGCLVVPIQGELDENRMMQIQNRILKGVEETEVRGVVIDLSGVGIIEPYLARIIDNTAKMVYLLGAKTILTGIRPGVAISLVDSKFDFKEIYGTAGTFEEGVKKLQSVINIDYELEGEEEENGEIDVEERVDSEEETEFANADDAEDKQNNESIELQEEKDVG
ncbi:MAG: STAS domain-containing protein [candidate division WOR-3 bacterium]|jgi:rsbT antagonist protein RsbS